VKLEDVDVGYTKPLIRTRTLVFVSHDRDFVKNIATSIIEIDGSVGIWML
jgi:ATPase subunit of ABC transporter with duplicated ATPase domains